MTGIGVVGLGYTGLALALAFARDGFAVTAYDTDERRIETLRRGEDPFGEGTDPNGEGITYTVDVGQISDCDVVFVAVPTPVTADGTPDTAALRSAGRAVGSHLARGALVVLQSTVSPGGTREELVPAVEHTSGWTAGEEFSVGYAPERTSPGDDADALRHVPTVVAADDEASRQRLVDLFESVVEAPVTAVPSIESCEAARCLESVQRDVNVALVNEFATGCADLPNVDPETALAAARTNPGFHDYRPGLVDGQGVPVGSAHLVHGFERAGHSPRLMRTAREVNDGLATRVADALCDAVDRRPGERNATADGGSVIDRTAPAGRRRVLAVGLTARPDVGDLRAPTTGKAIAELRDRGFDVVGSDPYADPTEAEAAFDIPVQESFDPAGFDAVVVFTGHSALRGLDLGWLAGEMNDRPALVDATGRLDARAASAHGLTYRRL